MGASAQASWKQDLSASARRVSAGVVGGLLTGAVIGGVGGRLAMLVLRLTSDPSLRGMETDDGFIIGRVSGDTGFLVLLTTASGILGGLFYLIVRPWIPEQLRPWVLGVFGGIVGGALVIRPDGIDFTFLEPLTLAVGMFIALPATYGVAMSVLVDRFLRQDSVLRGAGELVRGSYPADRARGPGSGGTACAPRHGRAVGHRACRTDAASIWISAPVVWIGRAGLLAATGLALLALIGDVSRIL